MTKSRLPHSLSLSLGLALAAGCAVDNDEVVRGAARVAAPAPGQQVWTEVVFDDGTTEALSVLTRDDLTLQIEWRPRGVDVDRGEHDANHDVEHDVDAGDIDAVSADVEAQATMAASATTSPAKCGDTAFSLMGHRWAGTFNWWFRAGTVPSGLGVDRTEAALRSAAKNIVRSDNACGRADLVGATASFKGRTTTGTQLTSSGACGDGDGKNVVDFGDLPQGVLGVACVFSDSEGIAVESDVRLNKVDHRWTHEPGNAACQNRYDVEAVMTHEFGHTFGLGHVSESGHGRLTMSTQINGPCQASERALGSGDVRGLRSLY